MPPRRTRDAAVGLDAIPRLRRILVATDGTPASQGALTMAGLLARHNGSMVDVVSVLLPWGPPAADDDFLNRTGELLEDRLAHVVPQSERALAHTARVWTVRVIDSSSMSDSIAETARAESHDVIVVGRPRSWLDRWFRRPTALAVARRGDVPVLAVPPLVSSLPMRAVVGVDGSDADVSVATAAARVLAGGAAVHLVQVQNADVEYGVGWAPRFVGLGRALERSTLASVEHGILRGGEPAARLAAYAKRTGADLIAVGTRRPASLADRHRDGVSRRVLRSTDCCVLLVRPNDSTPHVSRGGAS